MGHLTSRLVGFIWCQVLEKIRQLSFRQSPNGTPKTTAMNYFHLMILILLYMTSSCFLIIKCNETNEIPEPLKQSVCRVPKYPPYFWVRDISSTQIYLGLTDPNRIGTVSGYTAYYWGYRFGSDSTIDRDNRDFGSQNISRNGPHVISGLKPGFIYCADITAINDCGHGPFCIACFENIVTLQN